MKFDFSFIAHLLVLYPAIVLSMDIKCVKKKVVLDDLKGGWGNKLSGIFTSLMIGIQLARPVEVEWPSSKHLNGSLSDFFEVPSKYPGTESVILLEYNESDHHHHKEVLYSHTRCNIDLSAKNSNHAYWLLKSPNLFKKMDAECDVLRIRCNHDMTPLLKDPMYQQMADRIIKAFPRFSYQMLTNGVMQLKPNLIASADSFAQAHGLVSTAANKWASVHIRGLFDGKMDLSQSALTCVKSLIEKKTINKVYVATDQTRFVRLSKRMIPAENLIIYEGKTTVASIREMWEAGLLRNLTRPPMDPSYYIRNESKIAVVEWLVLRKADFCLSPTMSTFAATAMLSSNCQIIDSTLGADCGKNILSPAVVPTVDPRLIAQTTWFERYFAVNKTCDAACESFVWEKFVHKQVVKAHNTTKADDLRNLCSSEKIDENESLKKIFI